jgi:predicted dehydrogenase
MKKPIRTRVATTLAPKTIAILGAGGRGTGFARLISSHGHLGRVVAVAEPRADYRAACAAAHRISKAKTFESWQAFVKKPKMCDAVVIATLDRDHVDPAVACLALGYDVLLEKPMAASLADCQAIEAAQRRSGAIVGVCHSLRYHKGFRMVKELIDAGAIGRVMTLDQLEQVAYWHQAHSFVRGNWGNEGQSTPMLLAKSCHDIDYIAFLVGKDRPCLRVSSFGRLSHFTAANAPAGSTARCTEGCRVEATCPYSAIKAYVQTDRREEWPANVCSLDHSAEAHLAAIRKGPYGRCVYRCDNDVVDHQVVLMEFDQDVTATFTMTAFTQGDGRVLRVHGDKGELHFDESRITIKTFGDNNVQEIVLGRETGGHGGGDNRVVREWLQALHSRDDSGIVANAQESLRTHAIVFAAERSRHEQRTVELAALR